MLAIPHVYVFSGGTEVTVTGSNLDSVAEPLVSLTVIITRGANNVASAVSNTEVFVLYVFKRT